MIFEIEYGGSTHKAAAGLDTLTIYEQAFGSDLIQDVFGVVNVTVGDIKESVRRQGIEGENGEKPDDEILLTIDYTKTNWTMLVRALWACVKSYNSEIPTFETWSKETEGLDLASLNQTMLPVFNEVFFPARSGDAAKEADSKGRR